MVVAWASNSSSRSPKPMCASAVLGKSGLCYAQEFFRIAGHVLPQHVTVEVLPDRPIENHLGGVREMSLAVRVVRLMHQHPGPRMSITALVMAGPSKGSAPQRKRPICTYSIG